MTDTPVLNPNALEAAMGVYLKAKRFPSDLSHMQAVITAYLAAAPLTPLEEDMLNLLEVAESEMVSLAKGHIHISDEGMVNIIRIRKTIARAQSKAPHDPWCNDMDEAIDVSKDGTRILVQFPYWDHIIVTLAYWEGSEWEFIDGKYCMRGINPTAWMHKPKTKGKSDA